MPIASKSPAGAALPGARIAAVPAPGKAAKTASRALLYLALIVGAIIISLP